MIGDRVPESLPVLSRGKHRTPRKGGCFMEMASVLGGERWSDHPSCTHPLLAQLARMVNDHTADAERGELAVLIPSVVGLRGGDDRWVLGFTTAVTTHVFADVPEPTQRALAAGLIRVQQLVATMGPAPVPGTEGLSAALDQVPWAVAWARRLGSDRPITPKAFTRRSAPTMVKCAVNGVANAAAPGDVDARLRALLRAGIATAERLEPVPPAPDRDAPRAVAAYPAGGALRGSARR